MKWKASILVVFVSIFLRVFVTFFSYSGQGKPPMFGDFEAQRHWMEVTINLPVDMWYRNGTDNDLLYWGLDYPPVSAYLAWGFGQLARRYVPELVALHSSRGHESFSGKLFMRCSSLLVDVSSFFTCTFLLWFYFTHRRNREGEFTEKIAKEDSEQLKDISRYAGLTTSASIALGILFTAPASLLLIDHGHFQYNSLSLCGILFGILGIYRHNSRSEIYGLVYLVIGYVLCVNMKHMGLYYSLPVALFLLQRSLFSPVLSSWFSRIFTFIVIAITTIGAMVAIWYPFLQHGLDGMIPVVSRLFPFDRGLFEDKVANFWCSISILVKLKDIMDQKSIALLCAFVTLAGCIPSLYTLLRRNIRSPTALIYSLAHASLSFFIFSYQVHEKSILLPVIPTLLLLFVGSREDGAFSVLFHEISCLSMYPLLRKDGLIPPLAALLAVELIAASILSRVCFIQWNRYMTLWRYVSHAGFAVVIMMEQFVSPPPRLPYLYPTLLSLWGFIHFALSYIYLWIRMHSESGEISCVENRRYKKQK